MRILRAIYEWPPPWLGLAPAPYELTKAQVRRGHTVDVFSARWPNSGAIETVDNVSFQNVWRAPLQGTVALTSSILIFFKYLKWRKKNDVDIIHSHGHFAIWIYRYRIFLQKHFPWAREVQTPLVVHFHNTVAGRKEKLQKHKMDIKEISLKLDWPLAEKSDRWALQTADAFIFVSEELKQDAIEHYNADPNKCFVVETGVNGSLFRPIGPDESNKTRGELGLENFDKVILNVGAITERKNIHLLVEALSLLPQDYKLLLMGTGDPEYQERINEIIAKKHLSERIVRIGYTPYPQVPIAYQAADLFCLPSSFEGLPKVALEALACGTQVLGSAFNLEDGIEGIEYINELTAQGLANQIQDMVEHPRNVDVQKVVLTYSWDNKAEKIDKVYDYVKQTFLK